jgi:Bacterial RNA polymerase, alpha chain C terminal domain/Sigma-70, region 4
LSAKFVNATIEKTGNDKRLIQHQFNEVFKMINDTNLLQKFNMDTLETEIIVQRLQHNKTFSKIGTEIGLSDERARKLFYRSLKKLKAKIKNASERYTHFLEFTTLKKNKVEINATLTAQNNSAKIIAKEDYPTQSIDELELLGTKWKNVLHEKNIHYIADLVNLTKRELALFPKFGVFAVSQIELELSKNGFELKK